MGFINRVINRRLSRLFRYFLKKAFLLFLFFPFMFRMKLVFFVGIVLSAESFPQTQQGKAVQNARQEMEAGGWTALRTRQNALAFPLQELKEVKAQADLIQQDDKENQGDVEKQDEKESSNKFLATKFGEKMLDNMEEALNAYRQNDNSKPTKKREAAFFGVALLLGLAAFIGGFGAAADGKELDVRTEQDLSELRLNGA